MSFHLVRTWTVPLEREALWEAINDTTAYQGWWSWLRQFDPVPLEVGECADVVITSPLPYDLRLRLTIVDVDPPTAIRVVIDGDLQGDAALRLIADDTGLESPDPSDRAPATVVRLTCDATAHAPALRLVDRFAHALMVWGHRVVADRALDGFVAAHTDGSPSRPSPGLEDAAIAAAVAGTVSGLPSTLHALFRRRPLLDSTRAAATLAGPPGLLRGAAVHLAISAWWSAVLLRLLPRRHSIAAGAAAGLGIGLLDLGVIGRRFPAIRALPRGPQLADHVLFGAAVGATARVLRDRHRRPA